MRIMFLIPRMNNGGAERVVANLSNEFVKTHYVQITTLVDVNSFYTISPSVAIRSADININRSSSIMRTLSMISGFKKALYFVKHECKVFRPDVVISFLFETDLIMYLLTRKNCEYKWISSERNDPTREGKLKQVIVSKLFKGTDLFVAQSNYIKNYFSKLQEEKKVVIPNPVESRLVYCAKEENIPKTIVAVGRLMSQKNFLLLLRSYKAALKKIEVDTRLIIYGEGVERSQLEAYIKQNGLQNNVSLPGTESNVIDKIRNASVFVMSSDYEGFPNALLEAAVVGIPIIATDVKTGTVKEIVSDNMGIIVPVRDERKMTEAIVRMINDDSFRLRIRGQYSETIRKKYDITNVADMWLKAIERTVNRVSR